MSMPGAVVVGGPGVPQTDANEPSIAVPFSRATTRRTQQLQSTTKVLTGSVQLVDEVIEGSGYAYGIDLEVICTTAGNAAAVAYNEDAPYSVLDTVVFHDVNGDLVSATGYHLFLFNLYGGWVRPPLPTVSTDTLIFQRIAGAVATGGSFRFHLLVPIALGRRSLIGLVGNQDRAQKYMLRSDISSTATVYSVAPTAAGTVTLNRVYENLAVPAPVNGNGVPQEIFPDKFGVLSFLTQSVSPSAPLGGSTINHWLPRLGNTIRLLILVFRANGSRATAEANLPSKVRFLLGDTPIFNENVSYRRAEMYDRFGFDAPAGVVVYDFITDILARAGDEAGDDYLWTNGLANAQFEITYPSGFGATANSLTILTSDLQVPNGIDIYG